ncbi:hypothetical protein ACS0TY_006281 [Phlomoides rotata]
MLMPLTPAEAAVRVKKSAKDIVGVKSLIDKKAWPYVQNDLPFQGFLPPSPRRRSNLYKDIDDLDHAAKIKSSTEAEKYYAKTVTSLNVVLSKLG